MLRTVVFSEKNLRLICLSKLYIKNEPNLINALYSYNLLNVGKLNKDIVSLFLHYSILGVCNEVLEIKSVEKIVLYFNDNDFKKCELLRYFSYKEVSLLFKKLVKCIEKYLPLRLYIGNVEFNHIKNIKNGEKEELIVLLQDVVNKVDISRYTFSKLYQFTKKNNLTYLNKEYFNTLKSKQLLLT